MTEALKKSYDVCEEIGQGRFGIIFRCVSLISGDSFAVKSIDKRRISAGDSLDSQCLYNEPKILTLVSLHPNIIHLHDLYEDDSHLHMVLDLCPPSKDLFNLIVDEARPVFTQLVEAVVHIQGLGVVHRDIKPENVLFDSRDSVKLTDFGSADLVAMEPMRGVVGTPYYVAPEILAGREYGEKVDVWSCGVVLYIMLAGYPPFYGETVGEIFEAVMRGNLRFPVRDFQSVSRGVKDLLRKMLCKDASRRLSAEQVLRHPWITSGVEAEF
ncbi:phosphoenolpyruvate carboxylase kinase 1, PHOSPHOENOLPYRUVATE CARBOXYLASE KINASE 1 [Hibiscus trionum]|uniref:Phosphoenolpyruvate carboxylase kinase 1, PHOSPHOENOLPYRUVATE CARBOXYLASE KINASE 1 n=1 Tax=Hibiscus trionum TaxID=183268 RepID=A0A9W7H3T6_HIBTR|nr:phosphoenolpyruvate carboxylase kinase 1, PHOSPHOENOLPYRUVATE CARBOXYLASE KINASE 1 [Hibiscus trionum]